MDKGYIDSNSYKFKINFKSFIDLLLGAKLIGDGEIKQKIKI